MSEYVKLNAPDGPFPQVVEGKDTHSRVLRPDSKKSAEREWKSGQELAQNFPALSKKWDEFCQLPPNRQTALLKEAMGDGIKDASDAQQYAFIGEKAMGHLCRQRLGALTKVENKGFTR